ncbi:hypothetical protein Anapl_18840 [Anas platyrhynchos]|uniref:Uncharacterized protein n=1 Tax=Anas platyrhynchos TaxID=8839 RepID=R0J7L2_ANAPL|nr:hypothetical protein Anapl_18840 [Anas platyrhynchos]
MKVAVLSVALLLAILCHPADAKVALRPAESSEVALDQVDVADVDVTASEDVAVPWHEEMISPGRTDLMSWEPWTFFL